MNKADLFKHYHGEFQTMAKKLKSQDWFTCQWKVSVGLNERDQPYLTLRMANWDSGIHFESWITGADLERSTIPVAFHFESSREKTGIQRGKFYSYILEHGDDIISKLDGYKISPKSFQLLVKRAPFPEGKMLDVMESEYQWIPLLAPIMDDAIKAVGE